MNKKILIIIIGVLAVIALVLGIVILVMPEPEKPVEIINYDKNRLIETLGITRPNKRVERLFAIKTYEGKPGFEDMLKLALTGKLEYYELDSKSNNYMLVIPLKINGKMVIYDVVYSDYDEEYQIKKETPVLECYDGKRLPQNYGLLIRYSRPNKPKFAIKLSLGKDEATGKTQTATYMITNTEDGQAVKAIQFVKDDIEPGTQSFGSELDIVNENDEYEETTEEDKEPENIDDTQENDENKENDENPQENEKDEVSKENVE